MLVVLLGLGLGLGAAAAKPPNIIMMLGDDTGCAARCPRLRRPNDVAGLRGATRCGRRLRGRRRSGSRTRALKRLPGCQQP